MSWLLLNCTPFVREVRIVGFPAVRTRLLYMIVPLVGILMAGSMCIFVTGRLEQILYSANKSDT